MSLFDGFFGSGKTESYPPIAKRSLEVPSDFKSEFVYTIRACIDRPYFQLERCPRWAVESGKTYGNCSTLGEFKSIELAKEWVDIEKYREYRGLVNAQRQAKWFEENKVEIVID